MVFQFAMQPGVKAVLPEWSANYVEFSVRSAQCGV